MKLLSYLVPTTIIIVTVVPLIVRFHEVMR